jgi:hypothetical protein
VPPGALLRLLGQLDVFLLFLDSSFLLGDYLLQLLNGYLLFCNSLFLILYNQLKLLNVFLEYR